MRSDLIHTIETCTIEAAEIIHELVEEGVVEPKVLDLLIQIENATNLLIDEHNKEVVFITKKSPMNNKTEIRNCIEHFKSRDIYAYEDDGSVYVDVGQGIHVHISSAEVSFRADEYQNETSEC